MNYGIIRHMIGRLLLITGISYLFPVAVALIYGESLTHITAFIGPMLASLSIGLVFTMWRNDNPHYFAREGYVIVALGWILVSLVGSFPYLLIDENIGFADAFFESASGYSTTGASVFPVFNHFPQSLLFWRSFSLFLGGVGMLVFVIFAMPRSGSEGVYIMKAELTNPASVKLTSRVSSSIKIYYLIYLALFFILMMLLVIFQVPLFEAILLSFCIAGTGGFAIRPQGIGYYSNPAVIPVITVFMFLFGVNFGLYFLIVNGRWRKFFQNEELRWYLGITLGAIMLLCLNLIPRYDSFLKLIRDVTFTVTSTNSTTAYVIADINHWPVMSQIILLLLMISGAMSGSTTGGLKIFRVAMYIKTFVREIRLAISPNRRSVMRFNGITLTNDMFASISRYLGTYCVVFTLIMLLISWDVPNFSTAFSVVLATLNNTGHGLDLLGPASDYQYFSGLTKIILGFTMIIGRLEFFPIIILFNPRTWRKG